MRKRFLIVAVTASLVLALVGYFVLVNFVAPRIIYRWSEPLPIVGGIGNVDPFAFEDSKGIIHLFWAKNAAGNYDVYEKTFDGKN